jgi:hypothetical protein
MRSGEQCELVRFMTINRGETGVSATLCLSIEIRKGPVVSEKSLNASKLRHRTSVELERVHRRDVWWTALSESRNRRTGLKGNQSQERRLESLQRPQFFGG